MGMLSWFRFVTGTNRHGVRINWSRVTAETREYFFSGDFHVTKLPNPSLLPAYACIYNWLPFDDRSHPLSHLKCVRSVIREYIIDDDCTTLHFLGQMLDNNKFHEYYYPETVKVLDDISRNGIEWLCCHLKPWVETHLVSHKRKFAIEDHGAEAWKESQRPKKTEFESEDHQQFDIKSDHALLREPYTEELSGPVQLHFEYEHEQWFYLQFQEPGTYCEEIKCTLSRHSLGICKPVDRLLIFHREFTDDDVFEAEKPHPYVDQELVDAAGDAFFEECQMDEDIHSMCEHSVWDDRECKLSVGDLAQLEENSHVFCKHPKYNIDEHHAASRAAHRQRSIREPGLAWHVSGLATAHISPDVHWRGVRILLMGSMRF
jgi:hypothetical protein